MSAWGVPTKKTRFLRDFPKQSSAKQLIFERSAFHFEMPRRLTARLDKEIRAAIAENPEGLRGFKFNPISCPAAATSGALVALA